ncbi:hypothetical protein [uncultured Anaerococcus sp.]|uniref:hypothetical protein n=1 Tax=uncultured Anaerococcus sp. TaxID=293428 RepID=UPI0025FFC07C|nr:hypothetical protein [uncultured Anaerococcus sp.]
MKHRKIFMAIGLIFIMFFTARAYFIYQDLKIEKEIRESLKDDKAEIVSFINDADSSLDQKFKYKSFDLRKFDKFPDLAKFVYKSKGFGSASIYYGFYYIKDDDLTLLGLNKLEPKSDGEYFYKEKDSDNEIRLKKIEDEIYYFKETY